MTATIFKIPNDEHVGRVRAARRAAGLWVPGFVLTPASALECGKEVVRGR